MQVSFLFHEMSKKPMQVKMEITIYIHVEELKLKFKHTGTGGEGGRESKPPGPD